MFMFLSMGVIIACLYSGGTIQVVSEFLKMVVKDIGYWILTVLLFSLNEVVMYLVGMYSLNLLIMFELDYWKGVGIL